MKSMGSGWENLKIQLALKGLTIPCIICYLHYTYYTHVFLGYCHFLVSSFISTAFHTETPESRLVKIDIILDNNHISISNILFYHSVYTDGVYTRK